MLHIDCRHVGYRVRIKTLEELTDNHIEERRKAAEKWDALFNPCKNKLKTWESPSWWRFSRLSLKVQYWRVILLYVIDWKTLIITMLHTLFRLRQRKPTLIYHTRIIPDASHAWGLRLSKMSVCLKIELPSAIVDCRILEYAATKTMKDLPFKSLAQAYAREQD